MDYRVRIFDGLLCLWPGLRRLWRQGSVEGLMAALLFAAILQSAILACLIWPGWLSLPAQLVVCFVGSVFWLAYFVSALRESASFRELSVDPHRQAHLFRLAQGEYLRGNWFQAETLLSRLIEMDAEDVEARLYLATMNRHLDQLEQADKMLAQLESDPAAQRWRWELGMERQLLVGRKRELQASNANAMDAA